MTTWRAQLPNNRGFFTFGVEARNEAEAKSKLAEKMEKTGFWGTLKLWQDDGCKVVEMQAQATLKAQA